MNSSGSGVKKPRKKQRIVSACASCRKRKIKCNGQVPCTNCLNYKCECVYQTGAVQPPTTRESHLTSRILKLAESLQGMEDVENSNISNQIDNLKNLIEEAKLEQQIRNSESTLSKESSQANKAFHTRFSQVHSDSKIIDENFSMNSLYLLLSNRGRSWFVKKCAEFDPSYSESLLDSTKNALFFIDMVVYEKSGVWINVSSTEELEKLIEIDFGNEDFIHRLIEEHYEEIASYHRSKFISKETLQGMKDEILTNKKLLISDTKYLSLLSVLLECSSLEYSKSLELDDLENSINVKLFLRSLIKYCVHLVRAAFFSFNKVENIRGILQFLKFSDSKYIDQYLSSLFVYSIDVLKKVGLHMMEYYVGLEEEEAEVRRELFWEFYCFDKKRSLLNGQLSLLNDVEITCFYPTGVESIRQSVKNGELTLNSINVSDYVWYYEIELNKIVSDFQSKLEPKRKVTSPAPFLERLSVLKESISKEIRPGNSTTVSFELNDVQILQIQSLHVQYYTTLFYFISNTSSSLLSSNQYSDTQLDCCFHILEKVFETEVSDFSPVNSLTKNGIIAFLHLIESFINNPAHSQSPTILKFLIKFQFRMVEGSSAYGSMFWRITNVIANYMLEPCVQIFKKIRTDPTSLELEIKDYEERLVRFKGVISSYRNQHHGPQNGLIENSMQEFEDLIAPVQDLSNGKKLLFVDSRKPYSPPG